MPVFTEPTDRVDGATEAAADFNTDVLDNIRALIQHDGDTTNYDEGTDKTTTSTSFVAIDVAGGTDLRASYTVEAGEDVIVRFMGFIKGSHSAGASTGGVYLNILLDGVTYAFADDGMCVVYDAGTIINVFEFVHLEAIFTGLSNATHTFDVYWKVYLSGAGTMTATLYAGAATTSLDIVPRLDARKL